MTNGFRDKPRLRLDDFWLLPAERWLPYTCIMQNLFKRNCFREQRYDCQSDDLSLMVLFRRTDTKKYTRSSTWKITRSLPTGQWLWKTNFRWSLAHQWGVTCYSRQRYELVTFNHSRDSANSFLIWNFWGPELPAERQVVPGGSRVQCVKG